MTSRDIDFNILISILIVAAVILTWLLGGAVIGNVVNTKTGDNNLSLMENTSTTSTTLKPVTTSSTTSTSTSTSSTTLTPECFLNSDCGVNGSRVVGDYVCHNGDIYRQYTHYRCSKPGTSSAKCIGRADAGIVRKCGMNEYCMDGEPLCEYSGHIDDSGSSGRPPDSTLLGISNRYNNSYGNYLFCIVYVFSRDSEPGGIAVDVYRPDGNKTRIYCGYKNGVKMDDLVIGLNTLSKWSSGTWANIWIQERVYY